MLPRKKDADIEKDSSWKPQYVWGFRIQVWTVNWHLTAAWWERNYKQHTQTQSLSGPPELKIRKRREIYHRIRKRPIVFVQTGVIFFAHLSPPCTIWVLCMSSIVNRSCYHSYCSFSAAQRHCVKTSSSKRQKKTALPFSLAPRTRRRSWNSCLWRRRPRGI